MERKIMVFCLIFSFFCISGSFAQSNLPQTGQTKCYDSAGAEIACAGTGQDGETRAGVPWPDPRFTPGAGAEADCITDSLTGLVWAKNANLANGTRTWQGALDFANALTLCGHSDWRLPNVNELQSLFKLSQPVSVAAWLMAQGFINVQLDTLYWSSTTNAEHPSQAWALVMWAGVTNPYNKTGPWVVWPVRDGQNGGVAAVRKTNQTKCYDTDGLQIACAGTGQDGEIQAGIPWPNPGITLGAGAEADCFTESLTGLMWPMNGNLPNGLRTWQEALDFANALTLCGHSDWRLPNLNELLSLIDRHRWNPAVFSVPFVNVQSDRYWSSTTYGLAAFQAWTVLMGGGQVSTNYKAWDGDPYFFRGYGYVLPVRGGRYGSLVSLTEGWNFVSFPWLTAAVSPTILLSAVSSNVRIVWGYNNETKTWLKYLPDGLSTLTLIEPGKGYWIYMDGPGTLASTGPNVSHAVQLFEGWNLVGFTGEDGTSLDQGLSTVNGKWSVLWNWGNSQWWGKHSQILSLPAPFQPLSILNQGKAYWIKIKPGQATSWAAPVLTYSSGTFSGPWLWEGSQYVIGDGSGNITDWSGFNYAGGSYQVQADGATTITILVSTELPIQLSGFFTSSTTLTVPGPVSWSMTKVSDLSACSGTWSGNLVQTAGGNYPITFTVNASGAVTSFTGFTGPVTGKMFSEGGKVVAHFLTGVGASNPYNQITFSGTRTGNTISGSLYIDNGAPVDGTFSLTKQ
jgi:hypothetical protein